MRSRWALYWLLSCLLVARLVATWSSTLPSNLNVSSRAYDVIVYKATPGGIAASIAAAEMGVRVLLLESTAHMGGMATEGGIGLRDAPRDDYMRSNPRSSQRRWGRLNAAHYGLLDKNPKQDVVIWQPDSWVGEKSFLDMLEQAGVEVLLNTDVVEGSRGLWIDTSSRRIEVVLLENNTWIESKFFIDASYEGEVMQAAGVDYTYGREAQSIYNETWGGITNSSAARFNVAVDPFQHGQLLPYVNSEAESGLRVGDGDKNVMAYSYRVCLTQDPNLAVPVTPPENYRPEDFEIVRRLVLAERRHNKTISEPWLYLDYIGYEKIFIKPMKYDACCGTSPVGIDAVGLATKYASASRSERAKIAADHRYYVQGLLWFWRSDTSVPWDVRAKHLDFGLCGDEWTDNGHFPRQLYIREAARMVGDRVFSQSDRQQNCIPDSIAVGSWGFDIHDMQRVAIRSEDGWRVDNEGLRGDNQGGLFPFEIPYSTILPKRKQMTNLFVINTPSVSHVAFSAIRTEPTLWQLGQAAGTAAAIASLTNTQALHDVQMGELQMALIALGAIVHWPPAGTCKGRPMAAVSEL